MFLRKLELSAVFLLGALLFTGCCQHPPADHIPGLMLEIKTSPGLPGPQTPLKPVRRIQVSSLGHATLSIDNVFAKEIRLSSVQFDHLKEIIAPARLVPNPSVVVDAEYTVLTRYTGGCSDGSVASSNPESIEGDAIPNLALNYLQSIFDRQSSPAAHPRPAMTRTAASALPNLIDHLSQSYHQVTRREWERRFASAWSPLLTPGRRDKYLRDIASLAMAKNVPVIIVETFEGSDQGHCDYQRVALWHGGAADADRRAFDELEMVQVRDEGEWKNLMGAASKLLESTDPGGPDKRFFDGYDAMVVTRFDTHGWTMQSWQYMRSMGEMMDAKREQLDSSSLGEIRLVGAVNRCLGKGKHFAEEYDELVERYGDISRGER